MSTHRTLGDFLVDLYQNAVESGASTIGITLADDGAELAMTLTDDGCGMDEATLARALDPFWSDGVKHPHRRVGLGLPFVVQTLEATQGRFRMASSDRPPHRGTEVEARFNLRHWDTPPRGDWAACLAQVMAWHGDHEVVLTWQGRTVARSELREALGGFDDPQARGLLRQYFGENASMEAQK